MDRQLYITINGTKVPVTEDVYRAYIRPVWAERKRKKRESQCRDERGNRCEQECSRCTRQRTGSTFSLDSLIDGGFDASDPMDVVEIVTDRLLLEELFRALAELDPDNRRILSLFGEGRSEREIAVIIGLSQKAISKRKAVLFAALRNRLKDFNEKVLKTVQTVLCIVEGSIIALRKEDAHANQSGEPRQSAVHP